MTLKAMLFRWMFQYCHLTGLQRKKLDSEVAEIIRKPVTLEKEFMIAFFFVVFFFAFILPSSEKSLFSRSNHNLHKKVYFKQIADIFLNVT